MNTDTTAAGQSAGQVLLWNTVDNNAGGNNFLDSLVISADGVTDGVVSIRGDINVDGGPVTIDGLIQIDANPVR